MRTIVLAPNFIAVSRWADREGLNWRRDTIVITDRQQDLSRLRGQHGNPLVRLPGWHQIRGLEQELALVAPSSDTTYDFGDPQ